MAEQIEVDLLIKALSEGFEKLSGDLDKLGKSTEAPAEPAKKTALSFTELKSALDLVVGAAKTVGETFKAAFDFAQLGATVIQTESSFTNLIDTIGAAPNLLQQLESASGGTIDKLSLMSSTATLLAGTSGTLATSLANATPQLLEIARAANKLNPSLGDTAFLYESISKGIKRASPLILDNLGIVVKVGEANKKYAEALGITVKEMTAADKQMALLTATLEAGGTLIEQAGGAAGNAVDDFTTFTTSVTNLKNALATLVTETGVVQTVTGSMGDGFDFITTLIEAQRAGVLTSAEAWNYFWKQSGQPNMTAELLEEVNEATREHEQDVTRLMNATSSASVATAEWAENTFYAEQALGLMGDAVEENTGTLYALDAALLQINKQLDFVKDATALYNAAIKTQSEDTAELNLRQIELLYVTGQITDAEKADLIAKNEQIAKLQKLNTLLEKGWVTWEQYLQIVADGKVTMDEMAGAVSNLWGEFLDMNLESDTQMYEDMDEAAQGLGVSTGFATDKLVPFAQAALDAGAPLSSLAGGATGLAGEIDAVETTAAAAALQIDNMATAASNAEGDYDVNIHVNVTGDQIPNVGGYNGAPTGPTTPTFDQKVGDIAIEKPGSGGADWRTGLSPQEIAEIGNLMGGGYGLAYAYELVTGRALGQSAGGYTPGTGGAPPFAGGNPKFNDPTAGGGKGKGNGGMPGTGDFMQAAGGGTGTQIIFNYYGPQADILDDLALAEQLLTP